jgi:hypothetical protein
VSRNRREWWLLWHEVQLGGGPWWLKVTVKVKGKVEVEVQFQPKAKV